MWFLFTFEYDYVFWHFFFRYLRQTIDCIDGYLFFCFDENETTQSEHFYVVTAELTKKTEATKKFVAPIHSICMKCHGDIVKPTGGKMLN